MAQLEGIGPVHTVFMASGQGSQKPGMGVSLFGVPEVQAALECASDVFDRDMQNKAKNWHMKLNPMKGQQRAALTTILPLGI